MGIQNSKHKGLEELYIQGKTKHIGARYHTNIRRILDHLAAITDLQDCEGVKDFHELKGAREGTYAMHVTGNYCITFKWNDHDVYDLDFENYH